VYMNVSFLSLGIRQEVQVSVHSPAVWRQAWRIEGAVTRGPIEDTDNEEVNSIHYMGQLRGKPSIFLETPSPDSTFI
jgi:hypothetical protein